MWVAQVTQYWVVDGKLSVEDLDPLEAVLRLQLGVYYLPSDKNDFASGESGRYVCHEDAARRLLKISEESLAAYNLLVEICANYILRREPLTGSLVTFSVLHLTGEIEKPKKKRAYQAAFTNQLLYTLAQTVSRDFGLSLTRNEATAEKKSACDSVSQGLAKNGHHRTSGSIKEICVGTTHKRTRQFSEIWVEAYNQARTAGIIPADILDRYWYGM